MLLTGPLGRNFAISTDADGVRCVVALVLSTEMANHPTGNVAVISFVIIPIITTTPFSMVVIIAITLVVILSITVAARNDKRQDPQSSKIWSHII